MLRGYFDDFWVVLCDIVFFSRISSDLHRHFSITSGVINLNPLNPDEIPIGLGIIHKAEIKQKTELRVRT